MKHRIGLPIGLILLVILYLAYLTLFPQDNSLIQLQKNDLIRIGYAIEAPYSYIGTDGNATGEAPEIAEIMVASLEIDHIEWIQTDFDLLIEGLLEERFDVIAAGMFITENRANQVQFSNPTFHVQPGLLVLAGNPLQLHSYDDIANNSDARVAVLSGAVAETLLREAGVTDSQLVHVPDALTGEIALRTGVVDALVLSMPTVRWMATNDPSGMTEVVEMTTQANLSPSWGYGGFAFRQEDQQLYEAWNSELGTFIGSIEHINLIAQFGFTEAELPGTVTTKMVLNYEN